MNNQTKKPVIVISSILFVVVCLIIGMTVNNARYSAAMRIEISPASSTVTLDGKLISSGSVKVTPGNHTVDFSMAGFTKKTDKVLLIKGESRYVGEALVSNSAETANWYITHPLDGKLLEGISSKNFDQNSSQLLRKQPFLKLLPFTAAGSEFKVDYGPSKLHPDSIEQAIYITANSAAASSDALLWIKNQHYDPSTMELIFLKSPEVGQPINNSNTSL